MNKKKVVFILNPISGTISKVGILDLTEERLDKDKFDHCVTGTQHAGHATDLAREAVEEGVDLVVAVSGDGTVSEVGRSLINTKSTLGILPCGSGDGLVRHLNLPMNLKKCIDITDCYDVKALDYGIVNSHPFFCTCGVGFNAFISMKLAKADERGPVTYMQKVLEEGSSYESETYVIEDEDGTHRYKVFLVPTAGASQYGNNAYITPQASMSDGLLDIIIMEPFDLIGVPQVAIELFNKTLDKNLKIKIFRAKHIHIRRKKEGVTYHDGGPITSDTDVDTSVVPKGINIVVNPKGGKDCRQPNMLQTAFSEIFYNIDLTRQDLTRQSRKVRTLNKNLLRKLGI